MNDNRNASSNAGRDDDAEWRPFQVWAATFKTSDRRSASSDADGRASADTAADWNPYTVWKRQVQGS